jgi:hypothetical protein
MSSDVEDACVYCVILTKGGWHRKTGSIPVRATSLNLLHFIGNKHLLSTGFAAPKI